eukprot:gb/GEZJ01001632.1/.p1 GENE.gb/GEZJ01001632.1/~~gb/GEZJ01001632.1/.p1  ORF type:complete len:611 (-),score=55.83 gb/GEZJ01001632.1/:1942-3774(-)
MVSRTEAFLCFVSFYVATIGLSCSRPVAPDVALTEASYISPVFPEQLPPKPYNPTPIYSLDAVNKFHNFSSDLDKVSIHNKKKPKNKKKKKGKKNKAKKKKQQVKKRRAPPKNKKKDKKKPRRHRPQARKSSQSSSFKPWQGCKTEKRACGKVCTDRKRNEKCRITISSPRLCTRKIKEKYVCAGQKVPMCQREEKELSICTKMKRKTMPCDEKMANRKKVCKKRQVTVKCVPKLCATFDRTPCEYKIVMQPCDPPPPNKCNKCVGKYILRQCSRIYTRQVEVECPPDRERNGTIAVEKNPSPPATSPTARVSPTPSPTPRPFEDSSMFASNARCLASLFDEEECRYADMNCQLFSDSFDSTTCAVQVCHDCRQLRYMPVSPGLKRYCFELLQSSCRTLYSIHQVAVYRAQVSGGPQYLSPTERMSNITFNPTDGKCYKPEAKKVSAPCNLPIPSGKTCLNGCVVGTCKKKIEKGFCRGNLPDRCKKTKKCKKTQTECSSVAEDAGMCEYKIPTEEICNKKKKVSHPCFLSSRFALPGGLQLPMNIAQPPKNLAHPPKEPYGALKDIPTLCTRVVNKKYRCRNIKKVRWVQCQQKKGCRKKTCTKEVCRK